MKNFYIFTSKWSFFRLLLSITGILLVIYTLYLLIGFGVLHLGVVLPFFIGGFLLIHGLFWQKIVDFLQKKWILKRIWQLLWAVFLVWFVSFLIFISYLMANLRYSQTADFDNVKAIIVLGTGFKNNKPTPVLASRLDKSASIANKNPQTLLILTGGVGFNKTVSEASVMRAYLLDKYRLKNPMALESKSISTELNLKNSQMILANANIQLNEPIVIVTSDFHTLRALAIAKKQGFGDVMTAGAVTPVYIRYNNWLREYFAFVSGWVLGEY